MRASFGCLPPWTLLTLLCLTECSLLVAWLCREYFIFDYNCFLVQIADGEEPAQIHVLVEQPATRNQTRVRKEVTETSTQTMEFETTTPIPPHLQRRPKIRKKKRPSGGHKAIRTVHSEVRIEPLVSLLPDGSEQTSFKTKTTFNKFHKLPRPPPANGTRRRRKKKRPFDSMARRQAAKRTEQTPTSARPPTPETTTSVLPMSTHEIFKEMLEEITSSMEEQSSSESPVTFKKPTATFEDLETRWRTHGIGGPTSIAQPTESLNFSEQLQHFAANAICVGRTLLVGYALAKLLTAVPFLLGIRLRARCLFTPFMVFSAIFLVIVFIYAATLTVFSLVLFLLVDEMKASILLDWMLFAAALDAVFILALMFFVFSLQNCERLVAEFGRTESRTVEVPESMIVDAVGEPAAKKFRSKSLLYAQLAVDDFFNNKG